MNCCTGNCRQGRDCPNGANPTRAALYLHQDDGGHTFHRGVVFPIEREEDDAPLCEPYPPLPLPVRVLATLCAIVCLLVAAGLADPLFPKL